VAERTPPTAAIKQAWIGAHPFRATTTVEEREAEFDRWLAEVKAGELRVAAIHAPGGPRVSAWLRERADQWEETNRG
jgi:hypothetical protein